MSLIRIYNQNLLRNEIKDARIIISSHTTKLQSNGGCRLDRWTFI